MERELKKNQHYAFTKMEKIILKKVIQIINFSMQIIIHIVLLYNQVYSKYFFFHLKKRYTTSKYW